MSDHNYLCHHAPTPECEGGMSDRAVEPSVPSSGRQRRKLRWHLSHKKCPTCRNKTIGIVKGQVVCMTCGRTQFDTSN